MPDCVQGTLGRTKTSGPPGTAEVSVPPEPENKSRRHKKKNPTNTTHLLHSFLKQKSLGRCHLLPRGEEGEEETLPRNQKLRRGQSFKGNSSSVIISLPNQEISQRPLSVTFPKHNKSPKKSQKNIGCVNKRGGGAHGPPLSSGKPSQGTRAPRAQ